MDVQNTQRSRSSEPRAAGRGADRAELLGPGGADAGRPHEQHGRGGNQQMEQIYMTVNGSRQTDTTVQVDGMKLNSLMSDGQVQA